MSRYPALKACVTDAGGAVLTREMVEGLAKTINSPEYRERERKAAEERGRQMSALNLHLKTEWAKSLGKTVDQLTKQDMAKLNEACFQAWLKYKGVTESEFNEFFGIENQ